MLFAQDEAENQCEYGCKCEYDEGASRIRSQYLLLNDHFRTGIPKNEYGYDFYEFFHRYSSQNSCQSYNRSQAAPCRPVECGYIHSYTDGFIEPGHDAIPEGVHEDVELPADEEREKCEHYGGELMVVAEGEKYAHTQNCHCIGGQETKHVLEGEGIGGRGDGHSNEDGE